MRTIAYLFIFFGVLYGRPRTSTLAVEDDQPARKFLQVTKLDTSVTLYGRHIEVKQVLPVRTEGLISNNLDDRDLIGRSQALFSFSRMLTVGIPPIKPVLYARK